MENISQENIEIGNEPMQEPTPVGDGMPYFMGEEALIKFSSGEEGYGPETYWLVNKKDHTIRPFESMAAVEAAFGEDVEQALSNVVVVSQPMIDSEGEITEGILADFSVLGPEYAIKEDATSKPLHFSSHQLKNRFGKDIDEKSEGEAAESLDAFLKRLRQEEGSSGIPPSFIDKIEEDSKLMAFYISSLAYGKYTLKDVYSDILHTFEGESN